MPLPLRDIPESDDLAKFMLTAHSDDVTPVCTVLTLFRISRELYGSTERFFAHHGVSDGKWSVLMLLQAAGKRRLQPSQLAERLAVTPGTITGLLKGLERDGYVSRREHPSDRRRDLIVLLRKGSILLSSMMPKLAARHTFSSSALTREERLTLVALLEKIAIPDDIKEATP